MLTNDEVKSNLYSNLWRFPEGSEPRRIVQGPIYAASTNLDLAIEGSGFFILEEPVKKLEMNGSGFFVLRDRPQKLLTRNGAFGIDKDSFITDILGRRVLGYQADEQGNLTSKIGALQIFGDSVSYPKKTGLVQMQVNFNLHDPVIDESFDVFFEGEQEPPADAFNYTTNIDIVDGLGVNHTLKMFFTKIEDPTAWDVHLAIDGKLLDSTFTLIFNEEGALDLDRSTPIIISDYEIAEDADLQSLEIQFNGSIQSDAPFSINTAQQDGHPLGYLRSTSIDPDGLIAGDYSNGQSCALGQILLGMVPDRRFLEPAEEGAWRPNAKTGDIKIHFTHDRFLGKIISGALEDISNQAYDPNPFVKHSIENEKIEPVAFENEKPTLLIFKDLTTPPSQPHPRNQEVDDLDAVLELMCGDNLPQIDKTPPTPRRISP